MKASLLVVTASRQHPCVGVHFKHQQAEVNSDGTRQAGQILLVRVHFKDDGCIYAGTKSGDVLQINLKRNVLRCTGPKKQLPGGVTAVCNTSDPNSVLIGTGDGILAVMRVPEEV